MTAAFSRVGLLGILACLLLALVARVPLPIQAPSPAQPASEYIPLARPYSVPGLGEVTAGTHATEKHGNEAVVARAWLAESGRCQDCTDGKVRCVSYKVGWAAMGVYVRMAKAIVETTVFLGDEDYADVMMDRCGGGDGDVRPAAY